MKTFRRLQQLLGKSWAIYSELGSTSHHPTFTRYIKPKKDLAWSIAHISGEMLPYYLVYIRCSPEKGYSNHRCSGLNLPPPAAFSPACCW
nr:unnamed protein product [Callosobruchus chinensis]